MVRRDVRLPFRTLWTRSRNRRSCRYFAPGRSPPARSVRERQQPRPTRRLLEGSGRMKGPWPKFFFFPAAAIALVLVAFFFKIYGPMTRPDVPRPIEMAVAHYVPGVAIGK